MRVLVTGGAGFIGSRYVRSVLEGRYPALAGADVVVLDKLSYAGNRANLDPVAESARLSFDQGDIIDRDTVDAVMSGADLVVHFAAESHVDRSITGAADFVLTDVLGTQTLLDSALRHDVGTFVHVSTDEVYGSIDDGAWPETHPVEPHSPYSASKAGSDLLARAYARTYGLDVRVTRCSNNYGPYQFPEKVIPLFVTNLLDGGDVPLYGDGLERPGLAARRRPLPRHPARRRTRPRRRDLQHRRRHRAHQPPRSPSCCWRRATRTGAGSGRCRTGSGTTVGTPWTSARSALSSATAPAPTSRPDCARRCSGTGTTGTGGSRSSTAPHSTGCRGDPLAGDRGRRDARA